MKAFHFRLDPALRWRSTLLRLEREAVSKAARQVATVQAELNAAYSDLRTGATDLASAGSVAFDSWTAYVDRCRRRILAADDQLHQAKQSLGRQTQKMVVAHQRLRVLENLKRDDHAEWMRELSRETEAFADEAFLAGILRSARVGGTDGSRARIEKRTGA